MAGSQASIPALRLVNEGAFPDASSSRAHHAPHLRTVLENKIASQISAIDPRWVFAVQVAKNLDGGRAASLAPDRRKRLVAAGVGMGLRTFDANLIIAVVQDGVRTGEGGLSREVESRLAFIKGANRSDERGRTIATVLLIAAIAVGVFCILARWAGG
jgi:hypothetical protein